MRETSLWGILMTWLISKYQEFITFLGSIFCSGQELLSWLNNRAALGVGFKRTELFSLEISMSFLLSTEEDKSLPVNLPNGRIALHRDKKNQGSFDPWKYL